VTNLGEIIIGIVKGRNCFPVELPGKKKGAGIDL
jgi:hypothetical protein